MAYFLKHFYMKNNAQLRLDRVPLTKLRFLKINRKAQTAKTVNF